MTGQEHMKKTQMNTDEGNVTVVAFFCQKITLTAEKWKVFSEEPHHQCKINMEFIQICNFYRDMMTVVHRNEINKNTN